ncbi:MAG: RHS repeat domain-containing protein, partial [Terriglobales bacterium]
MAVDQTQLDNKTTGDISNLKNSKDDAAWKQVAADVLSYQNNPDFKKDLKTVSDLLHQQGFLPDFDIVGVDEKGQFSVKGGAQTGSLNDTGQVVDNQGRILEARYGNQTQEYTRDTNGNIMAVTTYNDRGIQTGRFAHDSDTGAWLDEHGNKTNAQKIDVDPKTGSYTITNNDGSKQTLNTDGSGETITGDKADIKTNPKGLVTEVTQADGTKRSFQYDDQGQLKSYTDGSTCTTYVRDDSQQPQLFYATNDSSKQNPKKIYAGQPGQDTSFGGEVIISTVDRAGNLIGETQKLNPDGSVLSVKSPASDGSIAGSIKNSQGQVTQWEANPDGQLRQVYIGGQKYNLSTDGKTWLNEDNQPAGKSFDIDPKTGNVIIGDLNGGGEIRFTNGGKALIAQDGGNRTFDSQGNLLGLTEGNGNKWQPDP